MFGFNGREARLAGRVREMEEQNQLLRRQLSLSQTHYVNVIKSFNSSNNLYQKEEVPFTSTPTQKKPGVPCISNQVILVYIETRASNDPNFFYF